MAWTDLSAGFGYGTQLTSTQMQNLRDNIAAAFAQDSGAPTLADAYISSSMIGSCQIGADHIDSESILGKNIAYNAISSVHLAGSIISSFQITSGQIGAAHIAQACIDSIHISLGCIGDTLMQSGGVKSAAVASGAILNTHLANTSVRSNHINDASVCQAKLNTVLGEESAVDVVPLAWEIFELDGGTYGFYPQTVCETGTIGMKAQVYYSDAAAYGPSTYIATLAMTHITSIVTGALNRELQVRQRYVDACSEVFFIFILRDKDTKKIKRISFKPNHPAFMSGLSPQERPHPWTKIYDKEKHDVIVIFPGEDELNDITSLQDYQWGEPRKSKARVLLDYYDIVIDNTIDWPDKEITFYVDPITKKDVKTTLPRIDYIKIAKLVRK